MNDQFLEAFSTFQKNNERVAEAINSHIENITKTHQAVIKAFESCQPVLDITKVSILPENLGRTIINYDPSRNS